MVEDSNNTVWSNRAVDRSTKTYGYKVLDFVDGRLALEHLRFTSPNLPFHIILI